MAIVQITVVGNGAKRLEEATRILGTPGRARTAYSRAINHTGDIARTAAGQALSAQTGLPKNTGKRAVRRHNERSTPATLTYAIHGKGGDVSLKYFKPRETRKGVTAAPWNSRRLYPSTFMKAGWWPKRVPKPNWNGQVFSRANSSGYGKARNAEGKLVRSGTKFTKEKSGLFIPIEMVQGATATAFQSEARRLEPRVEHEIRRMTKGVFS